MPNTPEEIEQHEFLVTLRGYDKDAVKTFLASVAAEQKRLLDELAHANNKQATAFESLGDEVSSVVQAAHTAANEIKEKAEKVGRDALDEARRVRVASTKQAKERLAAAESEAASRIDKARKKADQIVNEAEASRRAITADQEARLADGAERIKLLQEGERAALASLAFLENQVHELRTTMAGKSKPATRADEDAAELPFISVNEG